MDYAAGLVDAVSVVHIVTSEELGSDPSLRAVADVGSVTVTATAPETPQEAVQGDQTAATSQPTAIAVDRSSDPQEDALRAAGFRLARGAWRRGR